MSEYIEVGQPLQFTDPNTPTRVGEIVENVSDIYNIPSPRLGMQVFVKSEKKSFVITSLKNKVINGVDVPEAAVEAFELVGAKSITWNNDTDPSNMNDFVVAGVYDIKGEHKRIDDNLPILNTGGGHSFNVRLTVLDSSISGSGDDNDKCITQVLSFSNRLGQGEVYVRTGKGSSLENLTWENWSTLQRNVNVGEVTSLDHLVDNGIYSGMYVGTGNKFTFVMVVINDYLLAGKLGDEKTINQFLYAVEVGGYVRYSSRKKIGHAPWGKWEILNKDEITLMISDEIRNVTEGIDPGKIDSIKDIVAWIDAHGKEVVAIYGAIQENANMITAETDRAKQAEKNLDNALERERTRAIKEENGIRTSATEALQKANLDSLRIDSLTSQVSNIKPIHITDSVINNAPDEEDLTESNGTLSLKNRSYGDGLGYVILRKNKSFGEQLSANTIYEIRYTFDLRGEEISIPDGCVFKFDGGSIYNGTIVANNCILEGDANINCLIKGDFLDVTRKRMTVMSKTMPDKEIIASQSQFENLLQRAVEGEDVDAILLNGCYTIDKTYNLSGNVHLTGSGETYISFANDKYSRKEAISITPTHYICELKNEITDYSLFVSDDKIVHLSEESDYPNMVKSTTEEIIDYDGNDFKLPIASGLKKYANKDTFINVFGWLDSLWDTIKFKVNSSDSKYFYCTLTSKPDVSTLNGDITTYNSTLNYVLYNLSLQEGKVSYNSDYIYIPLSFDNIEVVRNTTDYLLKNSNELVVDNVIFENCTRCITSSIETSPVEFRKCTFKNILGTALRVKGHDTRSDKTATITDCVFENCALVDSSAIYLTGKINSPDIKVFIKNCTISQYTDGYTFYKNSGHGVISYYSSSIENCNIYNCVRGGLFLSHGAIQAKNCKLFNTDRFNLYKERNYSRDFGMIYCNHVFRNDEDALNNPYHTIYLEGNRIHSFSGKGDTRGIFIDDGRGDVTCVRNIISDNESLSIDSRNIAGFSDGTVYTMSSIRNKLIENLCLTPYKLRYGSGVVEGNIPYAKNFVLNSQTNDSDSVDDIIIDADSITSNGELVVSDPKNKKILKSLSSVAYKNTSKASSTEKMYFGNVPIVHISYNHKDFMDDTATRIVIHNTLGITTTIILNSYTVKPGDSQFGEAELGDTQFGATFSCVGKYLAGRCNVYKNKEKVDIYFAICDGSDIISRHHGIIEWSHPAIKLNVEFLDADENFVYPTENLAKRYSLLNQEFKLDGMPTIDNKKFAAIIGKDVRFPYNELYCGGDIWIKVLQTGIFRSRGISGNRPSLSSSGLSSGFSYYDTTIKKPIWWTGTEWVDALGNAV